MDPCLWRVANATLQNRPGTVAVAQHKMKLGLVRGDHVAQQPAAQILQPRYDVCQVEWCQRIWPRGKSPQQNFFIWGLQKICPGRRDVCVNYSTSEVATQRVI